MASRDALIATLTGTLDPSESVTVTTVEPTALSPNVKLEPVMVAFTMPGFSTLAEYGPSPPEIDITSVPPTTSVPEDGETARSLTLTVTAMLSLVPTESVTSSVALPGLRPTAVYVPLAPDTVTTASSLLDIENGASPPLTLNVFA